MSILQTYYAKCLSPRLHNPDVNMDEKKESKRSNKFKRQRPEHIPELIETKLPKVEPITINKSHSCLVSQDCLLKIPLKFTSTCTLKTLHLDHLSVYYAENPVQDLDKLFDMSSSYPTLMQNVGDFKYFCDFLKEFLTFDVSHCKDMKDDEELFKQDIEKIYNDLKKLENLSLIDYLEQKKVPKSIHLIRMLENAHVASVDFLNSLIELMEEEFKDQGGHCYEFMYRTLYVDFFNACCLKTRDGNCYKKQLGIFSGELIQSEADLRCSLYKRLFFSSLKREVLIIRAVKRKRIYPIDCENFSILRDLGVYDVLGQHGGDLLVELSDSCFRKDGSKLLFGAIGVGTQLIFTVLEMNQELYEKITCSDDFGRNGPNKIELEKSYIHYTRPYDLLKSSDRERLYKPLFRLSCVQNH